MGAGVKASLKPGNERQPSPDRLVPISYRPANSQEHKVSDGERWETVAAHYGLDVKDLIWANFKTNVPAEINWYLNHYVACDTPTLDGYNWRFTTSARNGPGPRAGVIFIPQKAGSSDDSERLRQDLEDIQKQLKEIQETLRTGQEAMLEVYCALLAEAFARRGVSTDQTLQYLKSDELNVLLAFLECMILGSPRISPFLRGHPNASHSDPSSPMGDLARLHIYESYHFQDAVAKQGLPVDKDTKGFFHPATRSIHLPNTATLGQALHEAVHTFSSFRRERPVFLDTFGIFLYEGVTQLFTDMILEDRKWKKATRHDYKKELSCATKLLEFGLPTVANAYFRIDPMPLANAMHRRLGVNHAQLRELGRRQTNANLRQGHVLCERLGYL